jgi:hypothetical protein
MKAFEMSSSGAGKVIVLYDIEDDSEGLNGTRLAADANSSGLVCFQSDSDSDVDDD